ncbi:MAG: TIR domain-containing protein [Actinomycetota bacterium]|nr:TIR domain-containing protein [Actinomycetota bacterium]
MAYRLFISHPGRRTPEYDSLVRLLNSAPGFSWVNYGAPGTDPAIDPHSGVVGPAAMKALQEQIRPVQCVVVIAGMYPEHRDWLRAEMRVAKLEDKHMVGVRGWGSRWVPPEIASEVDEVAAWDWQWVVTAIDRWSW